LREPNAPLSDESAPRGTCQAGTGARRRAAAQNAEHPRVLNGRTKRLDREGRTAMRAIGSLVLLSIQKGLCAHRRDAKRPPVERAREARGGGGGPAEDVCADTYPGKRRNSDKLQLCHGTTSCWAQVWGLGRVLRPNPFQGDRPRYGTGAPWSSVSRRARAGGRAVRLEDPRGRILVGDRWALRKQNP